MWWWKSTVLLELLWYDLDDGQNNSGWESSKKMVETDYSFCFFICMDFILDCGRINKNVFLKVGFSNKAYFFIRRSQLIWQLFYIKELWRPLIWLSCPQHLVLSCTCTVLYMSMCVCVWCVHAVVSALCVCHSIALCIVNIEVTEWKITYKIITLYVVEIMLL